MKKETKRFIVWLIVADIAFALLMMMIGLLVFDTNRHARMELLGRGTGSFIMFADLAAVLIRLAILRRKKNGSSPG